MFSKTLKKLARWLYTREQKSIPKVERTRHLDDVLKEGLTGSKTGKIFNM